MKPNTTLKKSIFWVLFIYFISNIAHAQDTLRFKNQSKLAVKITSVDTSKDFIKYQYNHLVSVLSFNALEAYYYNGDWAVLETTPGKYLPIPDQGYFHRKTTFEQGSWSISTNVVSPFRGGKNRIHFDHGFQSGMMIGLAPEYQRGHWAIKMPFYINPNPITFKHTGYTQYHDGDLDYKINDSDFESPMYSECLRRSRYYWQTDPHVPTSIFEIGLYPKYYFGLNRKRSFYVSGGLSAGRGDHLAVDYYHTFTFRGSGIWFSPSDWMLSETKYVVHRNSFNYLRQELLMGLDFNFAKHFALNFESGFSSKMPYKGEKLDRVFAREKDGEYELAYTRKYDNRYKGKWSFIPVGKAHLVYRF